MLVSSRRSLLGIRTRCRSVASGTSYRSITSTHPARPLPLLFQNKPFHISSSIRTFSTNPSSSDSDPPPPASGLLATIISPKIQNILFASGSVIGTLAVAKLAVNFTSFFTHLTPQLVGKWGFYTGFTTATLMGGLAVFTVDALTIRADPVYNHCLSKIQASSSVMSQIGDGIVPGKLRSYRLDHGRFEPSSSSSVTWRPPRVQMLFDVRGTGPPYLPALVTCEAIKSSFSFPPKLTTTVVKVDFETGNEHEGGNEEGDQTIFLKGSPEEYARVSGRSGISLSDLASHVHINKAVKR